MPDFGAPVLAALITGMYLGSAINQWLNDRQQRKEYNAYIKSVSEQRRTDYDA